jgi:hypothetical protein
MSLLDEIKQKSRVEFRSLGTPEDAMVFYGNPELARCAEIGRVRLWPIADLLVENRDTVPGCYAQPCGYVVFASTIYGNAFCFDTHVVSDAGVPVVLIAHDLEPETTK